MGDLVFMWAVTVMMENTYPRPGDLLKFHVTAGDVRKALVKADAYIEAQWTGHRPNVIAVARQQAIAA